MIEFRIADCWRAAKSIQRIGIMVSFGACHLIRSKYRVKTPISWLDGCWTFVAAPRNPLDKSPR